MRLTTQMVDELDTIGQRVDQIEEEFLVPTSRQMLRTGAWPSKFKENCNTVIGELNIYKVKLENFICETDIKKEQLHILKLLLNIERMINHCYNRLDDFNYGSLDFERYLKMAMKIDPNDPDILNSHGSHLKNKQQLLDPAKTDYGYIEYFRKAMAASADPFEKERFFLQVQQFEAMRDFHTPCLTPIQHMIQIGKPSMEIMEPKWELYKISISFKYHIPEDVLTLKGSNHRVFFQNAKGNINLGVFFDDPDVEMKAIFWYNNIANAILQSLVQNEGLISIDEELKTQSCYVELHSHPVGANGRNNIIAVAPMKFLPIKEFEKRQKSINPNQTRAILSSAMTQIPDAIENKEKALKLKVKGNDAFKRKKYEIAEKFYSDALELNLDSRPVWTNRAKCRITMKKYEDALVDCCSALSIDPKCTKTITEKGNAHLGLSQFDEAKECYESLRRLGENSTADKYLEKLTEAKNQKPSNSSCSKTK